MKPPQNATWIVIPTYNRRPELLECLETVFVLEGGPYPVVIIDNGSTDDTTEQVEARFPSCHIIKLSENQGASQAANMGFEYALAHGAERVLRLDSDTVVAPDFLLQLANEQRQNPKTGILTGKIFYHAQPEKIWSLGAFKKRWDLGAVEFSRNQKDSSNYAKPIEVDFAWATGMLLTKELLEATGGFDPAFFVYYEEADLCLRAKKLGFSIRSVPAARMWHKIGQTARSHWIARNWSRSKMIYFRKHSTSWHRFFLIIYAYVYAVVHAIKRTKQGGNRGPLLSAIRGLNEGLAYPIHPNQGA